MILQRELGLDGGLSDDPSAYEADFNELPTLHRQHEAEIEAEKERIKYLIVRQKYFKPEGKQNFLTWAEMEQIRNLHKTDPEQWSIQKLVESFPATEEIVLKVVRARWTPKNMKRIAEHDASVRKTWESFRAGKLNHLDSEFVEHLKKFSHRNFDVTSNAYTKAAIDQVQFQFPKPKSQEFLHLISSMAKPRSKPAEITSDESVENKVLLGDQHTTRESIPPPKHGDSYVYGKIIDRKYKTFDQLKRNKEASASTSGENFKENLQIGSPPKSPSVDAQKPNESNVDGNRLPSEQLENRLHSHESFSNPSRSQFDRHASVQNPAGTGVVVDLTPTKPVDYFAHVQKYNTRTVSIKRSEHDGKFPIHEIKQRIYIPRKAYRRGALFKVNDCFYDDGGELLYRVPGMQG